MAEFWGGEKTRAAFDPEWARYPGPFEVTPVAIY